MGDCIFCKIASGEIPTDFVYEDEKIVAFKDINPAAPVHILIIPKKHYSCVLDIGDSEYDIVADIFLAAKKLAKKLGIEEKGFRIVNNCGEYGGQTVEHIHFHLLGGRNLGWPPG